MYEVSDRYSISRPTLKILSLAGVQPSDLCYEFYWKERDGWYHLDDYDHDNQMIASECNLSSVSFIKKRSCIYATLSLEGKWLYKEETQKRCELFIDQAIPQSLALAYNNRRVGETFNGVEFLANEKIDTSNIYETFIEIFLSVRWHRLSQARSSPRNPHGIYLF